MSQKSIGELLAVLSDVDAALRQLGDAVRLPGPLDVVLAELTQRYGPDSSAWILGLKREASILTAGIARHAEGLTERLTRGVSAALTAPPPPGFGDLRQLPAAAASVQSVGGRSWVLVNTNSLPVGHALRAIAAADGGANLVIGPEVRRADGTLAIPSLILVDALRANGAAFAEARQRDRDRFEAAQAAERRHKEQEADRQLVTRGELERLKEQWLAQSAAG